MFDVIKVSATQEKSSVLHTYYVLAARSREWPANVETGRPSLSHTVQVNMFGVKQQRVLVVASPEGAKTGRLQICTAGGKVKRDMDVSEIAAIEAVSGGGEDATRSVAFRFFASTAEASRGSSSLRTLLFVSVKQRDAFCALMEGMNAALVKRRSDGSLAGPAGSEAAAPSSGKQPAAKPASSASSAAGGVDLDSLPSDAKFFGMEENDWGYAEPRVLAFSDILTSLHVVDATAAGGGNATYQLRRIVRVSLHAGDKSTLQLALTDGTIGSTGIAKRVTFTFGGRAARERFAVELFDRLERLPEHVSGGSKYDVDDVWHAALPVAAWARFEATKVRRRRHTPRCYRDAARRRLRLNTAAARAATRTLLIP